MFQELAPKANMGMKNCARKCCLFLCSILFEVTWAFWNMCLVTKCNIQFTAFMLIFTLNVETVIGQPRFNLSRGLIWNANWYNACNQLVKLVEFHRMAVVSMALNETSCYNFCCYNFFKWSLDYSTYSVRKTILKWNDEIDNTISTSRNF